MNVRLESSCWSPALTAAAAWSDVGAERGDGEGVWPRKAAAAVASPDPENVRVIAGDPDNEREGGSEFKSGAIDVIL